MKGCCTVSFFVLLCSIFSLLVLGFGFGFGETNLNPSFSSNLIVVNTATLTERIIVIVVNTATFAKQTQHHRHCAWYLDTADSSSHCSLPSIQSYYDGDKV